MIDLKRYEQNLVVSLGGFDFVRVLENVPSTNTYIKDIECRRGVVLAVRQTAGKGRRERLFESGEGGLYMSIKFVPELRGEESNLITLCAGCAVCKVLESQNCPATIKYPNDVLIYGKKICGILTELEFLGDTTVCAVVGIGLNVYNDLSPSLSGVATTLFQTLGKVYDYSDICNLAASIINEFFEFLDNPKTAIDFYNSHAAVRGECTLIIDGKKSRVRVLGIGSDGRLTVEDMNGNTAILDNGELSIRDF